MLEIRVGKINCFRVKASATDLRVFLIKLNVSIIKNLEIEFYVKLLLDRFNYSKTEHTTL